MLRDFMKSLQAKGSCHELLRAEELFGKRIKQTLLQSPAGQPKPSIARRVEESRYVEENLQWKIEDTRCHLPRCFGEEERGVYQ